MGARKLSISMDEELVAEIEDHLDDQSLSGFFANAARRELEHAALSRYVDDLDRRFGPPSDELMEEVDELWPP